MMLPSPLYATNLAVTTKHNKASNILLSKHTSPSAAVA